MLSILLYLYSLIRILTIMLILFFVKILENSFIQIYHGSIIPPLSPTYILMMGVECPPPSSIEFV